MGSRCIGGIPTVNGYLKRAEHAFANLPNTCVGNQKAKPRFAALKRESDMLEIVSDERRAVVPPRHKYFSEIPGS